MNEVLFSATVLLCAVLLLRRVLGERISMRLRYGLWALVLLRLLLPVSLPGSPLSVLNVLPERTPEAPRPWSAWTRSWLPPGRRSGTR